MEDADGPYLVYDGTRPQAHGKRCQWANTVSQVYYLERKAEAHK